MNKKAQTKELKASKMRHPKANDKHDFFQINKSKKHILQSEKRKEMNFLNSCKIEGWDNVNESNEGIEENLNYAENSENDNQVILKYIIK